jgi:hypothetical protein
MKTSSLITLAASAALPILSSCNLDGEIHNPDGTLDHVAVIGWPAPWSVAESRAAEMCPTGYTTVSKLMKPGGVGELTYRCK